MAVKLDLITVNLGLEYPPAQATMERVFGPSATVPDIKSFCNPPRDDRRPSTTLEVTIPDGLVGGNMFKAKGPRGSFTVNVPDGYCGGQRLRVDVSRPGSEETELSRLAANG